MKIRTWRTTEAAELKLQLGEFERQFYRARDEFERRIAALESGSGGGGTYSVFTSADDGLAPASGGGTTNFLRADGTWAVPPGSGGGVTDGDKGDIVVSSGGTVWTIDNWVVSDSLLRVVDDGDATKELAFEVSGISTGTTRTVHMADAPVDLGYAQFDITEDFNWRCISTAITTNNSTFGNGMFVNASVGSIAGVITSLDDDHPGIARLGVPATANASATWLTAPHQSGGGDFFLFTFRTGTTFTALTAKIGQYNGNTSVTTEPTDGVYLWQTAGTSTFGFKTATGGTRTTGTTTTLSTTTWYTFTIDWNTARTSVICTLLDDAGAVIIQQTISTNLPGTAITLYAQASVSTSVATAVGQALELDQVKVRLGSQGRKLARGRPEHVGEWMRT